MTTSPASHTLFRSIIQFILVLSILSTFISFIILYTLSDATKQTAFAIVVVLYYLFFSLVVGGCITYLLPESSPEDDSIN